MCQLPFDMPLARQRGLMMSRHPVDVKLSRVSALLHVVKGRSTKRSLAHADTKHLVWGPKALRGAPVLLRQMVDMGQSSWVRILCSLFGEWGQED